MVVVSAPNVKKEDIEAIASKHHLVITPSKKEEGNNLKVSIKKTIGRSEVQIL